MMNIYIYLHAYSSVVILFFVKTMLHGLIYSVSTLKCSFCVRSCLLLTSCIISMYPLCYPCISINLFILHALYIIFTRFGIFGISIYIFTYIYMFYFIYQCNTWWIFVHSALEPAFWMHFMILLMAEIRLL